MQIDKNYLKVRKLFSYKQSELFRNITVKTDVPVC